MLILVLFLIYCIVGIFYALENCLAVADAQAWNENSIRAWVIAVVLWACAWPVCMAYSFVLSYKDAKGTLFDDEKEKE